MVGVQSFVQKRKMIKFVESVEAVYRKHRKGCLSNWGEMVISNRRNGGRTEVPSVGVSPMIRCYWNRESD